MIEVHRYNICFLRGKNNLNLISISSEQLSVFFKLDHLKDVMPIIDELYKKNKKGIKQEWFFGWISKKMFLCNYILDKKGCLKVVEKLKAPQSLKDCFILLLNN